MDLDDETYPRKTGIHNIHGPKFELDLTCLTYVRCLKLCKAGKLTSFKIANNMDSVGAFDDVVCRIEYIADGYPQTKLIFIQAKHHQQNSQQKFYDGTFFSLGKQQEEKKSENEGVQDKETDAHGKIKEEKKMDYCNNEMCKYILSYLQIRKILNENETYESFETAWKNNDENKVNATKNKAEAKKNKSIAEAVENKSIPETGENESTTKENENKCKLEAMKNESETGNKQLGTESDRKKLKVIFNCDENDLHFLYYTNAEKNEMNELIYFKPVAGIKIVTDIFDTSDKFGIHELGLENMTLKDSLPQKYKDITEDETNHVNNFGHHFNVYCSQEKNEKLEMIIKNEIQSLLGVNIKRTIDAIYVNILEEVQKNFMPENAPFLTEKINFVDNIYLLDEFVFRAEKVERQYRKWIKLFRDTTVENLYKKITKEKNLTIPSTEVTKSQLLVLCIQLLNKFRNENRSVSESNERYEEKNKCDTSKNGSRCKRKEKISRSEKNKIRKENSEKENSEKHREKDEGVMFLYIENSDSLCKWENVRNLHVYTKCSKIILFEKCVCIEYVQQIISKKGGNREFLIFFSENKTEDQTPIQMQFSPDGEKMVLDYNNGTFQGIPTTLKDIFGDIHNQKIFKNPEFRNLLDSKISNILKNEKMNTGSSLPHEEQIYIERKYKKCTTLLNYNAIEKCNDIFYIYPKLNKLNEYKNYQNIIIDDEAKAKELFFSPVKEKQNSHLCVATDISLEVLSSKGTLDNILKYKIEQDELNDATFSEYVLNQKCTILSDYVGMGKSTALKRMTHCIKNKFKDYLVEYIKLTSISNKLEKLEKNCDPFDGLSSLLYDVAKDVSEEKKNKVEENKKIFQYKYHIDGKVVLLFDGFDEISSESRVNLTRLLNSISIKNIRTVVATRPNAEIELNQSIAIFHFNLVKFDYENMHSYLKKYWTQSDGNSERKLETIVEGIVNQVKALEEILKHIIAVPLQTRMLAETYEDDVREILLSKESEKTFDLTTLSFYSLYENFIDKHFERCLTEKYEISSGNKSIQNDAKIAIFKSKYKIMEAIACREMFPSIDICEVAESDINQLEKRRIGILVENIDTKTITYQHRSYAEFLAAKYVSRILYTCKNTEHLNFIYKSIFYVETFVVLRKFMNARLENKRDWEKVDFNCIPGLVVENDILKLALKERNTYLFKAIFRHLSKYKGILEKLNWVRAKSPESQ